MILARKCKAKTNLVIISPNHFSASFETKPMFASTANRPMNPESMALIHRVNSVLGEWSLRSAVVLRICRGQTTDATITLLFQLIPCSGVNLVWTLGVVDPDKKIRFFQANLQKFSISPGRNFDFSSQIHSFPLLGSCSFGNKNFDVHLSVKIIWIYNRPIALTCSKNVINKSVISLHNAH